MQVIKVTYEHYRPMAPDYFQPTGKEYYRYTRHGDNKSAWEPAPRGGRTICKVQVELGTISATIMAEANCSDKDIFSYKQGRDIARFRAMRLVHAYNAMENLVLEEVLQTTK